MTILTTNPPALPDLGRASLPSRGAAAAGWTVALIATGLVVETGLLPAVDSPPARLVLTGLLLPLLAAGAQVLRLLGLASAAVVGALDPGTAAGGTDLLLAGLETRDLWATRALVWALGTGAGFLAWSVALLSLV